MNDSGRSNLVRRAASRGQALPVAGMLLMLLVGLFSLPAAPTGAAPPAATATSRSTVETWPTARLCPAGETCYSYARPRVMKTRFINGRYANAGGTKMPRWVFRKAKRYVINHPGVAPATARPVYDVSGRMIRGWDWGWLEWTKDRLNTARCLALDPNPSRGLAATVSRHGCTSFGA